QPALLRIFFDRIDWTIRQTTDDLSPRCAAVSRAIDVRLLIVEPDPVNRDVRSVDVEMARVELRDLAPRIDPRWRDVLPRLATIARDVDQTIVRPRPDHV